jgi:hypothetical protein
VSNVLNQKEKPQNGWKHGMAHTPEYQSWVGAKMRCSNPNNKNYGGRGITMCQAWAESFEEFYRYIGARPSPEHSLDRIDNNGNYEPGNCRWALAWEQSFNQRRSGPKTSK